MYGLCPAVDYATYHAVGRHAGKLCMIGFYRYTYIIECSVAKKALKLVATIAEVPNWKVAKVPSISNPCSDGLSKNCLSTHARNNTIL